MVTKKSPGDPRLNALIADPAAHVSAELAATLAELASHTMPTRRQRQASDVIVRTLRQRHREVDDALIALDLDSTTSSTPAEAAIAVVDRLNHRPTADTPDRALYDAARHWITTLSDSTGRESATTLTTLACLLEAIARHLLAADPPPPVPDNQVHWYPHQLTHTHHAVTALYRAILHLDTVRDQTRADTTAHEPGDDTQP